MNEPAKPDICHRIAQVRLDTTGPRGRAAFARRLGLSASTYAYYEADRVPPADILVRIADETGADLRWLLTGESSPAPVPLDHPVVRRAAHLLASHPRAADALAAFLDVLAASLAFPAKPPPSADAPPPPTLRLQPSGSDWIPVLGRTAAGVPQFWADDEAARQVTRLEQLVERYARSQQHLAAEASARVEPEGPDAGDPVTAQLITLRTPDAADVVEYVSAPALKRRHPDAFAVRVDGDSMAPRIRHGDLVILSPSVPAEQARSAVVQLRRQIGVTCKVLRREDQTVHLVPLNERFAPQTFPAADVEWALKVLGRVQVGE